MHLFLFPYAGASGNAYRLLTEHLPPNWQITTLELPGRGQRIREPLCTTVDEMVDDIYNQIGGHNRPFGFFGHSMGSILSYLTAQRLHREGKATPDFMICSGFRALHMGRTKPTRHNLDSAGFREELRKMGGVPDLILNDNELMDFFEPIIRADFKVSEEFQLREPEALPIPLYTMFGTREDLTEAEKESWDKLSTHSVERSDFDGEHFFIFSDSGSVAGRIISIAKSFEHRSDEYSPQFINLNHQ